MNRQTLHQAFLIVITAVVITGVVVFSHHEPAKNPDPNHTHADFAVWIEGQKLDFSAPKYMTEENMTDAQKAEQQKENPDVPDVFKAREYLHEHDGNGHVMHRHKPGLSIGDFFYSLGFSDKKSQGSWCWSPLHLGKPSTCSGTALHLYVNGAEVQTKDKNPMSYVFADGDHILLTDATDPKEVQHELSQMTDDACLYSRTCPWRGPAPTENCIADPTVPCVE